MLRGFVEEVYDSSAEFITIDGLSEDLIDRMNLFSVDENTKVKFEEFIYSNKDVFTDDEIEEFLDIIYAWCNDE